MDLLQSLRRFLCESCLPKPAICSGSFVDPDMRGCFESLCPTCAHESKTPGLNATREGIGAPPALQRLVCVGNLRSRGNERPAELPSVASKSPTARSGLRRCVVPHLQTGDARGECLAAKRRGRGRGHRIPQVRCAPRRRTSPSRNPGMNRRRSLPKSPRRRRRRRRRRKSDGGRFERRRYPDVASSRRRSPHPHPRDARRERTRPITTRLYVHSMTRDDDAVDPSARVEYVSLSAKLRSARRLRVERLHRLGDDLHGALHLLLRSPAGQQPQHVPLPAVITRAPRRTRPRAVPPGSPAARPRAARFRAPRRRARSPPASRAVPLELFAFPSPPR